MLKNRATYGPFQNVDMSSSRTSNLTAYRHYAEAVRLFEQSRNEEAVTLLERAVELAPHFALTYALLAEISDWFDPAKRDVDRASHGPSSCETGCRIATETTWRASTTRSSAAPTAMPTRAFIESLPPIRGMPPRVSAWPTSAI